MPSFSVLPGSGGFFVPGLCAGLSTATFRFMAELKVKDQQMLRIQIRSLIPALAGFLTAINCPASGFADSVIAYTPGTGFSTGFTNSSAALGAPTAGVDPFDPPFQKNQIVSLGVGGSLTVQFNTPIQNDPANHAYGLDFAIFGNSGFTIINGNYSGGGITDGSLFGNNTGSTRVWVSQDNITYYQLNPALAPTVDGLFPTDGAGNPSIPVNPALQPGDFAGLGLSGIQNLYNGSAGGSGYSISWAEDMNGNPVSLSSVDYVRVDVLSGKSEIDAFAIVPEPSTIAIALCSLALLLSARKTRRMAQRAVAANIQTGAQEGLSR